jgi:tetratricopeptide repeat protein 21B
LLCCVVVQVVAVHAYTQESQLDDAFLKLEDYYNAIKEREPNNAPVHCSCAQLFSRISCRQSSAISVCQSMLEHAIKLDGHNAKYFCELGHVFVLNGQYQSAIKMFKESSKKDSQSFIALEGMILCQLLEGLLDDAEAQIELLGVMHGSDDVLTAEYAYLQALLAQRKGRNMALHLEKLEECKKLFFSRIAFLRRNTFIRPLDELIVMDPDFMLQVKKLHSSVLGKMHCYNACFIFSHTHSLTRALIIFVSCPILLCAQLGVSYMAHLEAPLAPTAGSSSSSSRSSGGGQDHSQSTPSSSAKPSAAVESGMGVLQEAMVLTPGMSAVYIEMARVHLALNKHDEAQRLLRQCLQLAPNNAAALVSLAKVEISRRNIVQANRALEQALSGDFSVRSVPLFRLVQASVRAQEDRVDEATSELESIVQLPEFRQAGATEGSHGRMATDSLRLADDDIVSAFVVLAGMLSKHGRQKEARKVLASAKVMFAGTNQEVQVLIASSQLAVERNDFDSAIRMLDKINEDSPTYLRAQLIKAEILLNNSHDKEGFTKCYQELVDRNPTTDTYSLLGEAYLRILNPEAAVSAFREAFRRDPRNISLRARIGKALVATHEYHQAIDFYESSLRDMGNQPSPNKNSVQGSPSKQFANAGESVPLAHDLAKLYIKLGRMESASRVLTRILHNEESKDTSDMREDIQTLRLLSTVQLSNKQPFREVIDTLRKARELQKEVVNTLRANSITTADVIDAERQVLSDICATMGRCYMSEEGNDDGAEKCFSEALHHNPQNTKGMYDMASLRFRRGEHEQCAVQCNKILLANPANEEASVMLADILFRDTEKDVESCVEPLQQLLKNHPNHYNALQKLIAYLRRLGKLELAPPFIECAELNDKRSGTHAGLHYCKGLYAKYTNDVVNAIQEFNLSRKDSFWGADSLMHMIELYLNPDQEGVWEEDKGEDEEATDIPLDNESSENIRVAEALLIELRPIAK